MGFIDSILGEEERKPNVSAENVYVEKKIPTIPFRISTSFFPLRLTSAKSNSVNLVVKLKNLTNDSQLVSVDINLPRKELLGFDATCINKVLEKKVGEVNGGETKEVSIPIWANNQTPVGDYEMEISAYAHYQDYSKVLASVKKRARVRVV